MVAPVVESKPMPYFWHGWTMRILQNLRIGYIPCSPSFCAPGDRRRFCYYAAKRGLKFEIAQPSQSYDIVIITQSADISFWSRYPRGNTKIIFDFIDSYLSIPRFDPKSLLRGITKFAIGQNRRLLLNYKRGLEQMCRRAEAVICSTQDQKRRILSLCPRVFPILDFHGTVVRMHKQNYAADRVFHFVWEGLPGNLSHFLEIKDALQEIQKTQPFVIHAITDLEYGPYLNGRFIKRSTVHYARRIWQGMNLYAWNEQTFSAIACNCDIALIPLPLHNPLSAGKPENRLLLFWRMGVPALVSSSAAHRDVMQQSGIHMSCTSQREWVQALRHYMSDQGAREEAGRFGRAFVEEKYSEEQGLRQWDEVLHSVLEYSDSKQPRQEARESVMGDTKTEDVTNLCGLNSITLERQCPNN
jgi:glycosyltransferase involved in cell wall biosynthesis